jgi:RecA-family ATPase
LQFAVMVANGNRWAHWEARKRGRVLLLNAEDDQMEIQRRLHGISQVQDRPEPGWLFTANLRNLVLLAQTDGKPTETPLYDALLSKAREVEAALIVIDPLVETHAGLDENSNGDMMRVMEALRALARDTGAAVLAVHHGRKNMAAGEQDSARGGSALVNAARCVVTLVPLEQSQATLLPKDEQKDFWRYQHVTSAKQNYAPREGDKWLRTESFAHPNGENYPAMRRADLEHEPKQLEDDLVLMLLRENDWTLAKTGRTKGRADAEIAERLDVSTKVAREALDRLMNEGAVTTRKKWVNGNEKIVAKPARDPNQGDIPF